LRQAQGVVLVGLAFEVLELPGLAGGVGHQAAHAVFQAQVVDPAGQQAGLDDDGGGPFLVEELAQLRPCRLNGREADFAARWPATGSQARAGLLLQVREQWFAAAFHLRQLLAHKAGDADKLKERLKRCEDNLKEK
jgi:hypothetical protein